MIDEKYSKDNTHVINSYMLTSRNGIKKEVEWIIKARKLREYPVTRSVNSYIREWRGHNRLYKLGLYKSHTKDVDLEEYIKAKDKILGIFKAIIWFILGGI